MFSGVVIFVVKKLEAMQSEIQNVVTPLGGQLKVHYSSSEVTHVVFTGKANDLNREFRKARDDKKFIVSPEWVWMCRDESKRIDEAIFPHSYNPKMSLSITLTESLSSRRPRKSQDPTHSKKSLGGTPKSTVVIETLSEFN